LESRPAERWDEGAKNLLISSAKHRKHPPRFSVPVFGAANRRLILSLVHIRMEIARAVGIFFHPVLFPRYWRKIAFLWARIAGGCERVRTHFFRHLALIAGLIFIFGLGIQARPSSSKAQNPAAPRAALSASQDAGQVAPPANAAAAPKPVELPEGDGKAIATEYCQMCHKLTNLTKAHKDLDDWKDTIHTMMDRGAAIPDEKVDTLAEYLAKNFGPKDSASPTATTAAATAPVAPASSPSAAAPPAAASSSSANAPVVLPDGDGKAIATENCQACHKLTNLTKAHKSLDDWKDTVQTMIDRGANVQPDQVDTLVQYLAKNFGPKDAAAPATPSTPAQ
jgi:cytochrome c5